MGLVEKLMGDCHVRGIDVMDLADERVMFACVPSSEQVLKAAGMMP